MPIDNDSPDEIVLGKDLKIGDCVRSSSYSDNGSGNVTGIIVATTFHNDKKSKRLKFFYGNEPAYSIYDINCPSDGSFSSHLNPNQKFKVIRSRKDILHLYKSVEYSLLEQSAELMNNRNELVDIKEKAIERMNNRCDKLKKENVKNGIKRK